MVKHKDDETLCFRTITGRNVGLIVKKSPGCLCLSLKNESKLLSYKGGLSLGVATVCSPIFSINPAYILVLLLLCYVLYHIFFCIREERLLIVKGLGYQICREFLIRRNITFIPYEKVQKAFINEVILRHKVIYLLSLLVEEDANQSKLVPLFKDTLPRLDCLEIMYRNIKCFVDS